MKITVIPDSVRLDPVNLRLYEHQPKRYRHTIPPDYLENNPVWNSREKVIRLKSAGNEIVAFQVVLMFDREYPDVTAALGPLKGPGTFPAGCVELFKEWFVDVQVPSSGYEKTSLAPGWFPDALVPLSAKAEYYGAPFYLPDYWNRVRGQKAGVLWADIYVPENHPPGRYTAEFVVQGPGLSAIRLPVELDVWPFSLPHRNTLKGNIFTGAFKKWPLDKELRTQQLFKKHRISHHQCYYRPELKIVGDEPELDWREFDGRLAKYFSGEAFTEKHGYFGPGYGEPMEIFLLPKDETYWKSWEKTAKKVSRHLFGEKRIGPKTEVQIFFNALDECYDRIDHGRMIIWSTFIKNHFPQALFRIDGGFDDETMNFLSGHVDLCLYHTAAYDLPKIEKYRKKGIRDWIYGPMVYESRTNELTGSSTFIDLDLLTMRGLGWVCFKYNTESWCQWEFMYESRKAWYNPETFKNHHLKEFRCYNGSGMLLYDGEFMNLPDPCASIRFKAARSGAQEYEYLRLYEALGGNARGFVDKLIDNPLGEGSMGNVEPWNTDLSAWDRARLELGEAIAKRS
jgi:hypothetical protein